MLKLLLVTIFASIMIVVKAQESDTLKVAAKSIEPLPIAMYDTDVGFGYGAKAFFLNQLNTNESFDVVLFNSTKGERWYRIVYSIPDFEIRQGKVYSWALDVVFDYDKMIKNSFYGIGNNSEQKNREYYTKEPFEIDLNLSKGLSSAMVVAAGLKYRMVRNYNFDGSGLLRLLSPAINQSVSRYCSVTGTFRYDDRNSFVNPSKGKVIEVEGEYAPDVSMNNSTFSKGALKLQYYTPLIYSDVVLASRLYVQSITGDNLPVQILLPIGGTNIARGYPQDRYLDKSSVIFNLELRCAIYKRFGGIVGLDAGRVAASLSKLGISDWASNPVIGLRYYFDTFIVRVDMGFGKETTGFYFNFGHVF